ncbi:MAG TPA: thioredoxin domain-containing protein, partial [Aestuariivirgaceae bacterium]|nr:thioredoxin domain-containing protein [Aestuariivirgaceae bacterium]
AGLALSRPDWLAAAADAFAAILRTHWRDGVLWHSWRDGRQRNLATVDGYAHLAAAALRLHAATGDRAHAAAARSLVDAAVRHLWDAAGGAFHFSPAQDPPLIVRPRYGHDDAVPNGNATMVANLSRLYLLAGRQDDRERAESILGTYGSPAASNPFAYATLLNSFDDHLNRVDAVIVGGDGAVDGSALRRAVHELPAFDPAVAVLEPGERVHAGHPAHGKVAREGQATAYLCRGTRCSLPVVEPADLAAAFAALS